MTSTAKTRKRAPTVRGNGAIYFFTSALWLGVLLTAAAASAQTYTILHTLNGTSDGSQLSGRLILDGKGHLWGTTEYGGGTSCGNKGGTTGCGVIFKMDLSGNETVMYHFTGGADGAYPTGGLIFDASGNVYGVTGNGGDPKCIYGQPGCGTVYELDTTNKLTVLHTFEGSGGAAPVGSLYRDPVGNVYGATSAGGLYGDGVIYRISPNLTETVLHRFGCASSPCTDAIQPWSALISDSPGTFYGTSAHGGANSGGTVYKLVLPYDETVLHNFPNSNEETDGWFPGPVLAHDSAGNLYGATEFGGGTGTCGSGCGTIFEIAPDGTEKVLYRFTGQADGFEPTWVVIDKNGNLYGIAEGGKGSGGLNGYGLVFKLDTAGNFTVLHQFSNLSDGFEPSYLTLDPAGNLYGTAQQSTNGVGSGGIVFKLTP